MSRDPGAEPDDDLSPEELDGVSGGLDNPFYEGRDVSGNAL